MHDLSESSSPGVPCVATLLARISKSHHATPSIATLLDKRTDARVACHNPPRQESQTHACIAAILTTSANVQHFTHSMTTLPRQESKRVACPGLLARMPGVRAASVHPLGCGFVQAHSTVSRVKRGFAPALPCPAHGANNL